MTTAAGIPIKRYVGNGSTTNFSFPYYFAADSEIVVTHLSSAGVETIAVITTDYTVNGAGTATGSIDFPGGGSYTVLQADEQLTIHRVTTQDQTLNMSGAYEFSLFNDSNDKDMRIKQELQFGLNRSMLQPVSDTDAIGDLPIKDDRKGKYHFYNATTGDPEAKEGTALDDDAIHDNVAGEINAIAEKSTVVNDDIVLIEDSADSDTKKKTAFSTIATYLVSLFINSSTGAPDANKPIKLDANGHVDATMINSADVDHDATTNFLATEHFTQANITQVGTLTAGNVDAAVSRLVQIIVVDFTSDTSTGDGKAYFHIPPELNGMNLTYCHARVITAGVTGTLDIQIHNVTDTVDMLTTKLTVDSGETGSETAATPYVIDTANDDVAENDLIRIDSDAIHSGTAAKGLIVTLRFQKP
jgi:hypothetical protein